MIIDFLSGLLGSALGGRSAARRESNQAAERIRRLESGTTIVMPCAIREGGTGDKGWWTHGELKLGRQTLQWRVPASSLGQVTLYGMSAHIVQTRDVAAKEAWSINPRCKVLEVRDANRTIQLAILEADLPAVRYVMSSEPGQNADGG